VSSPAEVEFCRKRGAHSARTPGLGSLPNRGKSIAASHANPSPVALSIQPREVGLTAESTWTDSEVALEKLNGCWPVTHVHSSTAAEIPAAAKARFEPVASEATAGCFLLPLLNAEISTEANWSCRDGRGSRSVPGRSAHLDVTRQPVVRVEGVRC
jgi:hypothetical protein